MLTRDKNVLHLCRQW